MIIRYPPRLIRILVLRVEKVCGADPADGANGRAEVLMVTRREDASSALAKTSDTLAVFYGKTITGINREKPQFVNGRPVYLTQDLIISRYVLFAVARHDLDKLITFFILKRGEMLA